MHCNIFLFSKFIYKNFVINDILVNFLFLHKMYYVFVNLKVSVLCNFRFTEKLNSLLKLLYHILSRKSTAIELRLTFLCTIKQHFTDINDRPVQDNIYPARVSWIVWFIGGVSTICGKVSYAADIAAYLSEESISFITFSGDMSPPMTISNTAGE